MGVKKILVLAANPTDTSRLRLEKEVKEIQRSWERSQLRDRYGVQTQFAVDTRDWRRSLLDEKPHILHFCGHGLGIEGLALEDDETGTAKLLSTEAIAGLFAVCKNLECVVLNACYSDVQAEAIQAQGAIVIGMNQAIGDEAAREFAVGFYDGLFAGLDYPEAFQVGSNAILAAGIPEHLTPVIKGGGEEPAQGGDRVFISYRAQDPDQGLAQTFYQELMAAGHQPFLAGSSIQLGELWAQRILQELERSDYFLLLLSPQSVVSEMVMAEVQRAKELQEERSEQRPIILPIRVSFPLDSPLTYALRGYLNRIQQRQWQSAEDTLPLVQEVLQLIAAGSAPPAVEPPESSRVFVDAPDQPPLPVAEPELKREPGGSVPLTSGLYVERYSTDTGKASVTIEADCFEEILQPGALIRIKAPRQMGKTSLMARILHHAQSQGYRAIPVSLQRADRQMFTDLDKLLHWLCGRVGRRLQRLDELKDYWDASMGVKDRCNDYFYECLLSDIEEPIVLALDEVDLVFPHREVADDFFGLLRSWYEAARYGDMGSELWEKLRLVVVHSTEAYVPLEINQSPFNVGKNVELPELKAEQVQNLAHRYDLPLGEAEVSQLMNLVGGHPYLLRKGFYHLRRQDLTLAALLETGPTEAGIYSDHLRRHLLNLKRYPELATACREVVRRSRPVDLEADLAFKLESMGLIRLQRNEATPRNSLYQQYFREHLRGGRVEG
ncbi:AAA-like domain-containing protein [Sphaerothrix gracilis]|uniref:AAA-like domain-containing protein n=1 Tax=Sphaerothrix gracilis TaxID=3151835 RepID=UPI0031FC8187